MTAISVTSINQWYASLQIPLASHSGAFTDWLKFVPVVTYHFCPLFHIRFFADTGTMDSESAIEINVMITIKVKIFLLRTRIAT